MVGADVTENGTTFKYEKCRQKGAVYDVYAGTDIKTAYGTKVYSADRAGARRAWRRRIGSGLSDFFQG